MNPNNNQISEILLDVISEFYEQDRRARTFGTDIELYHSEIHMLQCIMDNPGLHIAGIARELGITRGAASQTIKRLERKKMITKEVSLLDGKKIVVFLTLDGKTACLHHKQAHEKYSNIISEILRDAKEEELDFLKGFLTKFELKLKD